MYPKGNFELDEQWPSSQTKDEIYGFYYRTAETKIKALKIIRYQSREPRNEVKIRYR